MAPYWKHPVNQITISDLIVKSPDTSLIVKVGKLINPIQKINESLLNYIAIEGNIGAGKQL